jgi:hypothetical protein
MYSLKSNNLVSGCSTEQIKENYNKVFHGLGKLDECYQMQLDLQAVPVTHAPRKIPAMLRGKMKQELNRMEKNKSSLKWTSLQIGYIIQSLSKNPMGSLESVWTRESSTNISRENSTSYQRGKKFQADCVVQDFSAF